MKIKLLSLLLFFTFTNAFAQWKWLNPKPAGDTGKSIAFINAQTGFIISGSQLLQTKDAGDSWEVKQDISTGNEIRFKNKTGYIVGDYGNALKSVDRGESWQKISLSTQENLNTVNILHSDTIYFTSNKSLIKSTDGGSSWSIIPVKAPNFHSPTINKSYFINSKVGHAVCNNGYILKTIDGGTSWYITESVNTFPSNFFAVYFVNSKIGFAAREHSEIFKTTDGGETWIELESTSDAIYSFYFLNENIGYITGEHGVIHKTTDGGVTWQWAGFQNGRYAGTSMYGIHFTDEKVGFATGMRGRIIKTTDGGKTWKDYAFTYNDINDMQFPTNAIGYALGSELYKTTDKGESWTTVHTGLDESDHYYRLAQFFSADTGYVVTHEGLYSNSIDHLLRTNDGGNTWKKLPLNTNGIRINSIYFLNNRVGYVSTDSYSGIGFVKTVDGGKTWQWISDFSGATRMHFINVKQGIAIRYGDLYRTTDGGVSWIKLYEVYGDLTDISFVNDKIGYISAEYNTVLKTKDGGATWEELKTEYDHLKAIAFYNENIGYITGEYGKNFKTSDGGLTWQPFSIPYGITSLSITRDKDIFAAGASGRILRSVLAYDEYSLKALQASDVTAEGAVLTAVATTNGDALTNIRLEYGKGMSFDKSLELTPAQLQANSAERYKVTLKDLEPGTSYFFRIRATYKGTLQMSHFMEFKTLPAFSINYEMALNVKTSSAALSSHIISNSEEITNIQFEYASDVNFTSPSSVAVSPGTIAGKASGNVEASVQNLKPGTRYYSRIKLTYKAKEYYGTAFSFVTRSEYLIQMQPPVVSDTEVKWGAGIETYNGDITKIVFEYGKTRAYGSEAVASSDVVPNNSWRNVQATITGLDPQAIYYYRVKALQGDKAIYSTMHMFRAGGGVLIEADKAEQVTGTSAILTGYIAPQGSMVSNIQIEYGETEAMGKTVAATPGFLFAGTGIVQAEVKDLAAGSIYYFRIQGTVNGTELYSEKVTFATAAPTGITDEEDQKLKVYPNPTQDKVHFSHPYVMQRIELYDPLGRLMLRAEPKTQQYELDLSAQAKGVYHVRVYHKGNVYIRKVVKL